MWLCLRDRCVWKRMVASSSTHGGGGSAEQLMAMLLVLVLGDEALVARLA